MSDISDLEERLHALEAKASAAVEAKKEGGVWGYVVALVLSALIALGGAWLMMQINKKNKELAKLRTEVEQQKIIEDNIRAQAQIIQHDTVRRELQEEADALRKDITRRTEELRVRQAQHDIAVERILNARSWEELDRLNKEGR